jgi:hypothetical protein
MTMAIRHYDLTAALVVFDQMGSPETLEAFRKRSDWLFERELAGTTDDEYGYHFARWERMNERLIELDLKGQLACKPRVWPRRRSRPSAAPSCSVTP